MGPGRRYYYGRERVNGRIVYMYYGAGETALLIAEIEGLRQEQRQQERLEAQVARNEFVQLAATPEELTRLLEQAQSEAARVLTEAGYHLHKRQWRKRRGKKE